MFGLLLLTGAVATSCSSDPDPVMDSIPYTRVLTPLNFEGEVVASVGTDILFRWEKLENADGYVLQLFEALGEEELAPDYETTTPAFEYEVTNEEVPFTATGLEVDKSYWARVKGVSEKLEDSHWAYLKESVATAAVRKSLEPFVVARTTESVTIGWKEAEDKADLTSVRIEKVQPLEGDEPVLYTLTDEDIEAAEATLSGLAACTNYKFTLLFGKSGVRGVATAWTRPSDQGFNTVDTPEAIYNALNGTVGEVKLLVEYREEPYEFEGVIPKVDEGLEIVCNPTIVGRSSEDGKQPVLKNFSVKCANGSTSLHLEDLSLDGGGNVGHFVNFNGATMTAVELVNCELTGSIKGIIYSTGAGTWGAQKFLMSGCYVHDINADGSVGGDFLDFRGGTFPDVEVANSTFSFCARTFLRMSDNVDVDKVNVHNCTFNRVATNDNGNNAGVFNVRVKATPSEILSTKNVFLNEYYFASTEDEKVREADRVRLCRNSSDTNAPVCSGNIYYNVGFNWFKSGALFIDQDGATFSEADAMAGGGMVLPNDPCSNSEAGKLYLTDPTIAAQQAGDPRWWNAVEPVVIRETKLTPEDPGRTWNFLEKTLFQTETVEDKTIIDNIQIYGPAEITMGKGVTFTAEGQMAGDKPSSGALGILVNGYGAVEVTTTDAGYNASLQVVCGEDRYTVQADGKTHKVLFGDLTGENNIYILSAAGVTITQVTWTDDLTPEVMVETLKTPAVLLDVTSVDEGTEQAVVASWEAVENAASYELSFRGITWSQTELTYTIDAATVATMPVGDYELTVQAKPVETSSKYAASEIGKAIFKVKEIVLGGEVTLLWDFDDAGFDTYYTTIGEADNTAADVTWDGLHIFAGGSKIKCGTSDLGRYVQMGGAGSPEKRTLTFKAPASGTLKVTASNTGDSKDLTRMVTVKVGDAEPMSLPGGYAKTGPVTLSFDITVEGETDVVIYPTGGLCFWDVSYTYVAAPAKPEPLYWGKEELTAVWGAFGNVTTDLNAESLKTATPVSDLTFKADSWTYKGLEYCFGGGKCKFGENNNSAGEKVVRIQAGTGDVSNLKQVFVFEAPAAGTLTVEACSSGDAARAVGVTIDTTALATQDAPDKTKNAALLTFDCSAATAGSKIYIYSTNSSINFFSFKYEM